MKNLRGLRIAICSLICLIVLTITILPRTQAASSASFSFSGNTTIAPGETTTVKLLASVPGAGMNAASGTLAVDNESCFTIQSATSSIGATYIASNKKFMLSDYGDGFSGSVEVLTLTLKAGSSACDANISANSVRGGFVDGETFSTNASAKITVKESTNPGGTPDGSDPTPEQSNDATLKSLIPNRGTLSPSFSSNTTSYTLEVDSNVNTVSFTATTTDRGATVQSGTTCTLQGNSTACNIIVKAENGTTKRYTVNVNKKTSSAEPTNPDDPVNPDDPDNPDNPDNPDDKPGDPTNDKSGDATLSFLEIKDNDGTVYSLSPKLDPNVNTYSITVSNIVSTLHISANPNDPNAVVEIPNVRNLPVGTTPVRVIVTAEDGSKNTYIINVTKNKGSDSDSDTEKKSSDSTLKDIIITDGEIKPNFSSNVYTYNVTVPNQVTSLNLKAFANDNNATVAISGNHGFDVCTKDNLYCNQVTIEVKAENGSVSVYTINVNRSATESDNKLENIIIGGGTINPPFTPDVFEYIVDVPSDMDDLKIDAIPQNKQSKVEIIGGENLKEGENIVLVKVTDENGFVQYYRLNVNKAAKSNKFLGLTPLQWGILLGALLLTGIFILLLFLLLRRKKDDEEKEEKKDTPIIEFKPEINIGSKNGTDDDYVAEGGVLNQYAGEVPSAEAQPQIKEAEVKEIEAKEAKEIPYDMYDEVVTKDELFDALQEATRTKDSSKLKMLYAQEMLNRQKEKIKEKEEKEKNQR